MTQFRLCGNIRSLFWLQGDGSMKTKVLIATAIAGLAAITLGAQSSRTAEVQFKAAQQKELVEGDLKGAIKEYETLAKGKDHALAAQALLRMAECYTKLGDADAQKVYQRLIRDFSDQTAAVSVARTRMTTKTTATASGPVIHQICAQNCGDTLSHDARLLASRVDGRIVVRDLITGSVHRFPAPPVAGNPCCIDFSADDKLLAYTVTDPDRSKPRQIFVANADGTGHRLVNTGNWTLTWSLDNTRLLVATNPVEPNVPSRLSWLRISDGALQSLSIAHGYFDTAKVSPDGRYIAFDAPPGPSGDLEANVYVMAVDNPTEVRISPSPTYQEPIGWTPDGKSLLFSQYVSGEPGATLWSIPITNGQPQGAPVIINVLRDSRAAFLRLSPDGKLYYRTTTNISDIYTASMEPATGRVTSLPVAVPTPVGSSNVLPRLSPNGHQLLYQHGTAGSNERTIHLISLDDSKDRLLADLGLEGGGGCWSPDGTSFLQLKRTQNNPVKIAPLRFNLSTGEAEPVFPADTNFTMQSCSATHIAAFQSPAIKVKNLLSGEEAEVYHMKRTPPNIGGSRFSRDGQSLAFIESLDESTAALKVVSSSGGAARELLRLKTPAEFQLLVGLAWSPDDHFVYYLKRAGQDARHRLFRVPAAGGTEEYMGLEGADLRDLDIATDGTKIAFSIGSVGQQQLWSMENFLPVSGR